MPRSALKVQQYYHYTRNKEHFKNYEPWRTYWFGMSYTKASQIDINIESNNMDQNSFIFIDNGDGIDFHNLIR